LQWRDSRRRYRDAPLYEEAGRGRDVPTLEFGLALRSRGAMRADPRSSERELSGNGDLWANGWLKR
jgi:hypothetical protein